MPRRARFAALVSMFLLVAAAPALAQVSMTTLGVAYPQSFDTLPATGSATWTNNSTIPGWYHARTGTGMTIVANNGGSNAGNFYSFGTGSNTERALGSVGSGNAAVGNLFWGVRLQNNTGTTITSLDVSYAGEQWRNGGATAHTAAFSYLVGLKKLTRISSDRHLGYRNAKVAVQDMLGMELGQYDHDAGARVTADGESLIKVEFKEKPWRNLAYPRIVGYFHEKDQAPVKFELYDYRDELQKLVKVEDVKPIQSRQTITRLAIEDLQQKLKVKVETRKIEYDRGLPDSLFTEERLKSVISNAVQRLDQQ